MNKRYEEISSVPIFCEFFSTLLHSYLSARCLYPSESFETRKKYGVPVPICTHEEVRSYVDGLSRSLAAMLEENRIEKVEVIVNNEAKNAIKEKLILEPVSLPRFEVETLTVEEMFHLEQTLRASLLKILQSFGTLSDLKSSSKCTWKVRVSAKMAVYKELLEKQKTSGEIFWLFEDDFDRGNMLDGGTGGGCGDNDGDCSMLINDDDGPFNIVPLRNVKSKFMEVRMHIEDFTFQEL